MEHVLRKLQDLPEDRTAMVTTWNPPMNHREWGVRSRNTIAPCHGTVIHFRVLNGNLYMLHVQRSGDSPVGVPSNMVQYAALGLMVEQITGYPLVEYVHYISDGHIFQNQEEYVRELIAREPLRLPTMTLNKDGLEITDIHDFRGEHFTLDDYEPHPPIRGIPVLT
jgi:thymidylate synthase